MRASVIIVTDGRGESVMRTLGSLCWLEGPEFEVIVVCGPTPDGTRERVANWNGRIKVAHCSVRNISVARNDGIAMAAGDIAAFLDDDAIPEPDWLAQIVQAYDKPDVGAVGGAVYDHTGASLQYSYSTVDRLGRADWQRREPAHEFNFPLSAAAPYIQGTNSTFRTEVLRAIGGFDEEYEFYLDESDLCCRLVDAGWQVRQLSGAAVHHKFLPSKIRSADHVTHKRFSIIKNKLYFSLTNNFDHFSFDTVVRDAAAFIDQHDWDIRRHVAAGNMTEAELKEFWEDVDLAWRIGLERGLSGARRTRKPGDWPESPAFLPFVTKIPGTGARTYCLVSQEYPPDQTGGIGRYVHQLATGIAARGNHVHVIAKSDSHDRVDFEDGVWVHWLGSSDATEPIPDGWSVPPHIWARAVRVADAVDRIAEKGALGGIYVPLWDCEAAALIARERWPVVLGLQTSLRHWLDSRPAQRADTTFMETFGRPMIETETRILAGAARVHAISQAISTEISARYAVDFAVDRLRVVPLGLADETAATAIVPAALPDGTVRLLFVGRLESRKGIHVLLPVLERLVARHAFVHVDIVGNDQIPGPDGQPYRAKFEANAARAVQERIHFYGEVSAEALRGFYKACDIFVAPSLFESFGLVVLEAMMHGKPSVACATGGMEEVGQSGETTLFAEPGDEISLERSLATLINDPILRVRMGDAARRRYEQFFTPDRMVEGVLQLLAGFKETLPSPVADERVVKPLALARVRPDLAKVSIVAPMLAQRDAISRAAIETGRAITECFGIIPRFFTYRCDFDNLAVTPVRSVVDLLADPHYQTSDVIIYCFGIYAELLDALAIGASSALRIVRFHNITPRNLVSECDRTVIDRSWQQLQLLGDADLVWADSRVNVETAIDHGINPDRIVEIPLSVEFPEIGALAAKPSETIELLFVGRIVPSKGVLDLLDVMEFLAAEPTMGPVRLCIVGNTEWSPPGFLERVHHRIAKGALKDKVEFVGSVDQPLLAKHYARAHVFVLPSYHEGFCVPVIEALRGGCLPVTYDAYNLRYIAGGNGRTVPTGQTKALRDALADVIDGLRRGMARVDRGSRTLAVHDEIIGNYIEQFKFDSFARQTEMSLRTLWQKRARGATSQCN